MSGPKAYPTLLDVQRTSSDLEILARLPNGETERWVFGLNDESASQYRVLQVGHSLDGSTKNLKTVTFTLQVKQGRTFGIAVQTEDFDKFLSQLYPPRASEPFHRDQLRRRLLHSRVRCQGRHARNLHHWSGRRPLRVHLG